MGIKKIKYLRDPKNHNKGTVAGNELLEKSIELNGLGRSILVSNDGVIIAGNKTQQKAEELGIEKVIEVETDGTTLVVVKRTDIKSGTKEFYDMAVADNLVGEANFSVDIEVLEQIVLDYQIEDWGQVIEDKINKAADKEVIPVKQSAQLAPPMEYVLIMAEPNSQEWEEMKEFLKLGLVRRGGYKEGSSFDAVGIERVIGFRELQKRIKKNADSDTK